MQVGSPLHLPSPSPWAHRYGPRAVHQRLHRLREVRRGSSVDRPRRNETRLRMVGPNPFHTVQKPWKDDAPFYVALLHSPYT